MIYISYKNGTPIIDSLLPYVDSPLPQKHVVTYVEGEAACIGAPKLVAPGAALSVRSVNLRHGLPC